MTLFTTSTSRVVDQLYGRRPYLAWAWFSARGPSSPLLFVIAIGPLTQILENATTMGLLHKIQGRGYILRTSLYADDVEVFVASIREGSQNFMMILERFGEVTSLRPTSKSASWSPLRVVKWILTPFFMLSRRKELLLLCDILGCHFQSNARKGWTFNILRINV
jgi:hypothetical protein